MTIKVRERGTITLPAAVRKAAKLDRPDSQVEVRLREDGVIELIPVITIPVDQAWYWTEEWQAGEREVDEEAARGEGQVFDSAEEFVAHLRRIAGDDEE
ncbi:MAG TPA: AbrB/MazE/SpoVT family DNA-binding domain-containing protein [Solirubrobacteraceae bacterium]|jgi:antitoxin MazE|nr:AbrB/MazE/SpoVT family DNA-binding domain-containing protein [Solirubrobacteraceae bacterium]